MNKATRAFILLIYGCAALPSTARAQYRGTFSAAGNIAVARQEQTATLLPDGRVLIAGGMTANTPLSSTEIYDPAANAFRPAVSMTIARRMHTATLLPDDRILIVGGYGSTSALASAELYDPISGSFTATGSLQIARGGQAAILLRTGKVLIVGGYGWNSGSAYPDVAPAELYDPASGTFTPAGAYVGRDGCDFCAPSVLLSDGTVLFPVQRPAQLYDPASDTFSAAGMMRDELSGAVTLSDGRVLFAGGEPIGRTASAELYDPVTRTFAATGQMTASRVWHVLTLLPDGTVLTTGGETDRCDGSGCWFAGSLASAELYDPASGTFTLTATTAIARETHTATLLADGRVLIAGGVTYGGIGMFGGALTSAELYTPDTLVGAPAIATLSDAPGQGAIFHAGTNHAATPDDPAATGGLVDIYSTGVPIGRALAPDVAIGGRLATVIDVSAAPGMPGVTQVRVRVPGGITPGPAVRVRITYADRPSREAGMAIN